MKSLACTMSLALLMTMASIAQARGGCCARSGGVAGCNSHTGMAVCRNGKDSKTCECPAYLSVPYDFPDSKAGKQFQEMGCCAGHRSVSGCDADTGRIVCDDGTYSQSCKCGN